MTGNYNIHTTDDDSYYYCPNDDCPCNQSNYNNYCCGHCGAFYNAYDEPICNDCGAPADFSSSYNYFKSLFPDTIDDLAKHYNNVFKTVDDDPTYYHGAYLIAYDEYQSAKRRNNESGEPYIRYI